MRGDVNVFLLQFPTGHPLGSHRVFVLFASTKTEGAIQKFGQILAVWIFVIAAFLPAAGAYVTFADLCPIEGMFQAMHSGTGPQS